MDPLDNPFLEVERALENWAAWHRHGGVNLGYPKRSVVVSASGKSSFEDFCDAADSYSATVVETLVNDLPLNQSGAIYNRWLGCSIHVRNREQSLLDAYEALLIGMARRGVF